ncbi:uncharacterized protein LOC106164281 [Lingula anatina]|uniref:Uncharacterized protein LOC106164281 n=1 Tax=Lingula anatina TaxID=7574 RepID=A0A1S3IH74_LINAN|nr:uncharacterized protein LOC106164281 [Lingula anatina]|eukprot:XP_013397605.2 uncharacterized protein LOC106164281 [Lingula anatina]
MLIYHLDDVAGTPLDILAMVSWAVQAVMQLGVVSIGALVNDQAHSPLLELNEAQLDIIPDNQLIPFQMFLNKLSVTPIGFSALGMFTIDKPTILTIIGMFLTYFFLMIQFKPSDVTVPCAGNFTVT